MKEILGHYRAGIEASPVLSGMGLTPGEYFLVSAHREENVDPPERLRELLDTLEALAAAHDKRVIVSTHPRTRRRLEDGDQRGRALDPRIAFLKPFGFLDYVRLETQAACVLSDSGTLTEESAILGFPAVMIRDAHERPEGMDEATVIMAGLRKERVLPAVAVAQAHAQAGPRAFRLPADYDVDNVSRKVLRIILSYVDYVNRVVWRKES
jgi:UDP-N-acetylglucosamine 2-epimerase (non-hydrolysing)